MADHDDFTLDAEFTAFRTGLLGHVTPPGPDAVRATVRHRRRVAISAGAALALVLVVGPVAAVAALDNAPPPPPPPAATTDPTTSPTATPSPASSPTPPANATSNAPDGRISRTDLLGTRLDLPAWRPGPACPDRGARLTDKAVNDGDNVLVATAHGDIDDDGATETVALIRCLVGQGGPSQVVAFDRDDAGRIVTVGQVVWSALETPQWLLGVEVRANGVVRVEVADIAPGGGWDLAWSQRQWRGYTWNGGKFAQSEGPRSFPDNPHSMNLQVTVTDLVYGPADDAGVRTGVITVTMKNVGPITAQRPRLDFTLRPGGGGTSASPGWYACQKATMDGEQIYCTLPSLAPGKELKLTFHIVTTGPEPPTGGTVAFRTLDSKGKVAPDFSDWDNEVTVTIK